VRILLRIFFETVLEFLLYLLIFIILVYLFHLSEFISSITIILIFLILHEKIKHFIKISISHKFYKSIFQVEQSLLQFNNKLNRTTDYHELLADYSVLFDKIFSDKYWVFYIFETTSFKLLPLSDLSQNMRLPVNIRIKAEEEKFIENVNTIAINNIYDIIFEASDFPENNFDKLVIIDGKSQTIALTFTNSQNLYFLDDKNIADLFARVIRKSGQILENTALYLDIFEKNLQIKKVFEVSEKLLTSLNTNQILDFLLDALDQLIPFDAAVIFLYEPETEKLYTKISKGYAPNTDFPHKIGQGACGWVAKKKQISVIDDVTKSKIYYPARKETRSQAAIPLQIRDELIGILCLESDKLGYFTTQSLDVLNIFANQAAIALNNAKQYEVNLAKQSLEHELLKASKVQKVLLPDRPPSYKDLNISFAHIASKIVSGDLFDLVAIDNKTLGVIIGDVAGKGADAAIMMSVVLAGFRAYKKSFQKVCEIMARLNNLLYESIEDGYYATLFYGIISTDTKVITYTNAGHNPPYLINSDGAFVKLTGGGIVLGFLSNETYTQKTIPFRKGDILVCYTDGITEALNLNDEEYGEKRLLHILQQNLHLNSYELKKTIIKDVNNFTENKDLSDDLTIVIVKYD
jgi:sigma-B regulation protein RsbU (phosphoserine phosphatase)